MVEKLSKCIRKRVLLLLLLLPMSTENSKLGEGQSFRDCNLNHRSKKLAMDRASLREG
jgi:hypothetical protein